MGISFAQQLPLKTKSGRGTDLDGWPGARVTYSYYLDKENNEVRHGKTTSLINTQSKMGGSWTGVENVTYTMKDGKFQGRITASYDKTYWYEGSAKYVNGKRQNTFKLLEKNIMPSTTFNVDSGRLDGKININTGMYHIIGEAKQGFWVGRLIIKQKDFPTGRIFTLFDQICTPGDNKARTVSFDYPDRAGVTPRFLNLDGIYPYKIEMPVIRYIDPNYKNEAEVDTEDEENQ